MSLNDVKKRNLQAQEKLKFSAFYLKVDSDKGKANHKCATVSKVHADHEKKIQKCDTVYKDDNDRAQELATDQLSSASMRETCVYIEEDEEEDETRASPQKVRPASAWPVFTKSMSIASTAQPDSAPLGQQRARLQSLPKSLSYAGKGSWQAFLTTFRKFASIFEWTEEKRDYLCLCLTDKASEFYALTMDRHVEMTYAGVVKKLERRFGYGELPETAMETISSARQGEEDSLDEWADKSTDVGR